MRARTALAVLFLVGGIAAAACTPPPTGGGSTTTTIPNPNCLNGTGKDLKYSGTPDVVGNLVTYNSTNGSCSGGVVASDGILVVAIGEPAASAECFGLGRESAYDPSTVGVTTAPANAWFCTDN